MASNVEDADMDGSMDSGDSEDEIQQRLPAGAHDDDVDELSQDTGDITSDEDGNEQDEELDTGLTENQGRLLYLIGLYTRPALTETEKEEWIRRPALLVLIYEGIVAQVLDYDYAPTSLIVEGERTYFNKSQEGASDLDFLREEELLNGLKLSSKSYTPVTCYQISKKGQLLARRLPKIDKDAVHEVVFAPGTRELLHISWRHSRYELSGPGGYKRISSVTETEDVSYVSSAYIPQCLRFGGRPTLSNAHRAHECANSASNIRDELEEIITLNSVSIIVAEYIPFGANSIVTLNHHLGSTERVQGGFYTALVEDDEDQGGTKFEIAPGLTSINILDYTLAKHINLEADINLPEDEGIIQVETFGVSLNADGTTFYGLQVEAVMDRIRDNISLDHLSRLLVDIASDSSTIVDSIITAHQRDLLYYMFGGNKQQRDKMSLIIANEMTPHLTAEEYLDRGEYENEIRQVIGDTRAAFDVSEQDTLIFGETGLLLAGPNSRRHEPLLCVYLQLSVIDLFTRNFWSRLFVLIDNMKEARVKLQRRGTDPALLFEARQHMLTVSDGVRIMGEILEYITESLETTEIPPEPKSVSGKALYDRLQVANMAGHLSLRALDLKKLLRGAEQQLHALEDLHAQAERDRNLQSQQQTELNTRHLVEMGKIHRRTATTTEIIQLMLAALLSFALLDRLTGDWTVMDTSWMRAFTDPMIRDAPLVWFLLNLGISTTQMFGAATAYGLIKLLQFYSFKDQGRAMIRVQIMQRLDVDRFNVFLRSKATFHEERWSDGTSTVVRVSWNEMDPQVFGKAFPLVTVEYDADAGVLMFVNVLYNPRQTNDETAMDTVELRNWLAADFTSADIFEDPEYSFRDARDVGELAP